MKIPEIIGWQLTTNENNVKMATLPQAKMLEIMDFLEQYAATINNNCDKSNVIGRSGQLKCELNTINVLKCSLFSRKFGCTKCGYYK